MNTTRTQSSTQQQLVDLIAKELLGWTAAPDRFLKSERSWIPKWRFQPFKRLDDAMRLLETAERYHIEFSGGSRFSVSVVLRGKTGKSNTNSLPQAIVLALVDALSLGGVRRETRGIDGGRAYV